MLDGNPTSRPTLSSTSTTSGPQKEKRGSNAGEKREKMSTIVSHPQLATGRELNVHKVHRPNLVWANRSPAILAQLRLDPRLGVLLRNCRPNSR